LKYKFLERVINALMRMGLGQKYWKRSRWRRVSQRDMRWMTKWMA
jgi:hypothetical protein